MKNALAAVLIMFVALAVSAEPSFEGAPKITLKHNKNDGDPVNIILIGAKNDIVEAMLSAGWTVADPLTVRNLAHEVESVVARRAYKRAPVSSLYLFGRKQDMVFEQLKGKSPKHRHHVRFWASEDFGTEKPAWFGAATYDRSVGLSKYNGAITHHIDPDVDRKRDKIAGDLRSAGKLEKMDYIEGVGFTAGKRNGEGDLYRTDGKVAVCYITAGQ